MLEIRDLHKRFGHVLAVDGVSLQLRADRIYALVGPNGCGKTTLLNLISGFYTPDGGYIRLGGERIERLQPPGRARLGIGRMFQEPRCIPEFTVLQNLTLCTLSTGSDNCLNAGLRRFLPNDSGAEDDGLLGLGGLERTANRPVAELSFGERRVLECLCLVARKTRVLLLDEPFAGVDPANFRVLADLLTRQARHAHVAVLVVSHEIPSLMEMADELILMDEGQVVARGSPVEVARSGQFREVYLT